MSSKKIKVLIVDDSNIVVERLSAIISEMTSVGPVLISNSFNQAVNLLNVETPDAVLLDIQLPEKNGIELLAFIKSNHPTIKTIIVTNRASAYYKQLCQKMGADGFIDKSTEFEKIPGIIEMLCCVDIARPATYPILN
ncbi:MAG: response regulator [Sphingobacteriales bacterium]|nr:MAG: response regulator [Sphingobacteriales bacterium]